MMKHKRHKKTILLVIVSTLVLNKHTTNAVTFSPNAKSLACPTTADVMQTIDIAQPDAPDTAASHPILLPIVQNTNDMCILSRASGTRYVPVGRSYDGNPWESSAGRHEYLRYLCDATHCQVYLPKEHTYHLTFYQRTATNREITARFLERASFGPTTALLNGWDYTNFAKSFPDYVKTQLALSSTSHREYFRKRLNSRKVEVYKYGMTGPRACEKDSRWRKYAFTQIDAKLSSGSLQGDSGSGEARPNPRYTLTIETKTKSGVTAYLLSFAGQFRTIVYEPFKNQQTNAVMDMTKTYYICRVTEMQGSVRSYRNDLFYIKTPIGGSCVNVIGGNPTVTLDDRFINKSTLKTLDLTGLSNTQLKVINQARTKGGDLLLTQPINNPTVCDALPDPYDNDFRDNFATRHKNLYPMFANPSRFNMDPPTFGLLPGGEYAIHDYRLILLENSITNPAMDGGGENVLRTTFKVNEMTITASGKNKPALRGHENAVYCVNVSPNIFNQDHCKLSYEANVCKPNQGSGEFGNDVDIFVTFNTAFVTAIKDIDGVSPNKIVAMDGLAFNSDNAGKVDVPCSEKKRSRWIPVAATLCQSPSDGVHANTRSAFAKLVQYAPDTNNAEMRDVYYYEGCHADDVTKSGFVAGFTENGVTKCFQNVHPNHMNIYDITNFYNSKSTAVKTEINNKIISTKGKLNYLSITGETMATWHSCSGNNCPKYIARFGDVFDGRTATEILLYNHNGKNNAARNRANKALTDMHRTKSLTYIQLKGRNSFHYSNPKLVCGSPSEVANNPEEDDYFDINNSRLDQFALSHWQMYKSQKHTVWTDIALYGTDQVAQRMAWALSEIMAVTPNLNGQMEGEIIVYDIFARNALGNYKDILREISFNPRMAAMLTFLNNKSVRYEYDIRGTWLHPDENYAREFMQLYTIGLHKLKRNGLPKLDRYGRFIHTYDNNNILSFARAWTGFVMGTRRGNTEAYDHTTRSYGDTMGLNFEYRDWFPKQDLLGGYIGDGYPLCWDLMKTPFLKKGATFRLLGGNPTARYQSDPSRNNISTKRYVLDKENSQLYTKICNPDPGNNNACRFAAKVVLDANLVCYGSECDLTTLVVVQVSPDVFYEYVERPCVRLAYYENAKKITEVHNRAHMCAHPQSAVAVESCCGASSPFNTQRALQSCYYTGEHVTFADNDRRCAARGGYACDAAGSHNCQECCSGSYNQGWPRYNTWFWTTEGCTMRMKIRIDGQAAIVHYPNKTTYQFNHQPRGYPGTARYVSLLRNINFWTAVWPRDQYTGDVLFPTMDNQCWSGECQLLADWTCLCDIKVKETMAYGAIPTKQEVLTTLKIGAFAVDLYDAGEYRLVESANGVEVYGKKDEADYAMSTVFKVTNQFREVVYFKNLKSSVLMGKSELYEMQNPPSFFDIAQPEPRDVHHETEAVIDSIFRHENVAPYISKQLIQRFGISNPSPRYVEAVANAFFDGSYSITVSGETFTYGDNQYGNLAATAAAILLDRESTSSILDNDPSHGSLREPILKVIAIMRAMDYTFTEQGNKNEYPRLYQMAGKIGQMAYDSPDQFSFFRPDNSPAGKLTDAGLTSPESQILNMGYTVGLTKGVFSLIRNGIKDFYGGFGTNYFGGHGYWKGLWWGSDRLLAGNYDKSQGYLAYAPTGSIDDIINDISVLLTAGRLSTESRAVLKKTYEDSLVKYKNKADATKLDYAIRSVYQVLSTAPEFHSTNLHKTNGEKRAVSPPPNPATQPYKAVVVLFLFGGMDSFNMLTPGTSCGALYDSYKKERAGVALNTNEMLTIDAKTSEKQPCEEFGVHHQLPTFKEIYDAEEGIFFANTGHLSKPVTKRNWRMEITTDLFSHNTMEQEAYKVDALREKDGTGVLGRLNDVLERNGYSVGTNSMNHESLMCAGDPTVGRMIDVVPAYGPGRFERQQFDSSGNDVGVIKPYIEDMNSATKINSGLYADHWSQNLIDVWNKTTTLSSILASKPTTQNYGHGTPKTFETISKMMAGHAERKVDRDVFYVRMGGFDAHTGAKDNLVTNFPTVEKSVKLFRNELKNMGLYENVTFVLASEFGRTITANSGGGTDHAWGGNYFMFGGDVKGGKILGKYPKSFDDNDPTNIGRGRLLPMTSWDAIWHGISQWMGVTNDTDMHEAVPNHENFGCDLFTDTQLYKSGTQKISGCGGKAIDFSITAFINEPRYLTGIEQKKICESALKIAKSQTSGDARCIIVDQKVIVNVNRRLVDGTFNETKMILEDYIDAGGSRRLAQGGSVTFSIEADIELTYEDTGEGTTATSVVEMTNALNTEMQTELVGVIENVTQLAEIVATTNAPTISIKPSLNPTKSSRPSPKYIPSQNPSLSLVPSAAPSKSPSNQPSPSATGNPSLSISPSMLPSLSIKPSMYPSRKPSLSINPSSSPSISNQPSSQPSKLPSMLPSSLPSKLPSVITSQPSKLPSMLPSSQPSKLPSMLPSSQPSKLPSMLPSSQPSKLPSILPSSQPSKLPSIPPSSQPSKLPSMLPSSAPSRRPTPSPTSQPTPSPTAKPTLSPTSQPTPSPTSQPTPSPTSQPTPSPTSQPTPSPTSQPTPSPTFQSPTSPVITRSYITTFDFETTNRKRRLERLSGVLNPIEQIITSFSSKPGSSKRRLNKFSGVLSSIQQFFTSFNFETNNNSRRLKNSPTALTSVQQRTFCKIIEKRMQPEDSTTVSCSITNQQMSADLSQLTVEYTLTVSDPIIQIVLDYLDNAITTLTETATERILEKRLEKKGVYSIVSIGHTEVKSPVISKVPTMSPATPSFILNSYLDGSVLVKGNMFIIRSKQNVVINGFDIVLGRGKDSVKVKVYMKENKFKHAINNNKKWKKIHKENVANKGKGELSPLQDLSCPILLRKGEKMSFYIVSKGKQLLSTQVKGNSRKKVFLENSEILLNPGIGLMGAFKKETDELKWNGIIRYNTNASSRPECSSRKKDKHKKDKRKKKNGL